MAEQKRFRIGNQTAWFAGSITEPFEYAVSNGFDAFEWFPDKKETGEGWQEEDLAEETRVYIRDTAEANDIRLSVHVPWRWSPFNQDAESGMANVLRLAEDVGAVVMNIHFYKEHGAAAFAEAIGPLIDELTPKGITLSIENTIETTPEDFNELFRLLVARSGGRPPVGMCLDLGHANLCTVTRNDYLRYIDLLYEDLPVIHAHLHENYGDSDRHLSLFTGPSVRDDSGIRGFVDRMKRRGFSGSLILEQWPDPHTLLNEARERLISIIGVSPGADEQRKPEIPKGDFAGLIASADGKKKSWREKLGWVHELFSDDAPDLTGDRLAYIAIYLRFLSTGQVKVSEDGSHYRPSHHAGMAKDIFSRLRSMETPENSVVLRKIYPFLPSFDSDFLRPEPLTRIRDIAHRNDIPQDLKREIKTTLQNKLHRNAGPEDLQTSSRLLKQITSPDAGYAPSFVEEFRTFHKELEEFFNARSLEERLTSVAGTANREEARLIKSFLDAKASSKTTDDLMSVLKLLTELRRSFASRLGVRDDSEAQQLLSADISMEDFSFVLLSRLIGNFTSQRKGFPWKPALQCLGLTVENLRIGGFNKEECRAITSEIETWGQNLDEGSRNQLLRLKATVDRCLRLAEVYTHTILSLFPARAERLGHALDVDEPAIRVFTEADIRSHPVFQLSKLAAFLLQDIRQRAGLPPWDTIVPGQVTGKLVTASGLSGLASLPGKTVIALLEKVEGDEEIPSGIRGMVVPHETPHLSHLAVRARQAGVVFAVCEDENIFAHIRTLTGKTVILNARDDNVSCTLSKSRATENRKQSPATRIILPAVDTGGGNALIKVSHITINTGGGKAFGARRLRDISEMSEAGFRTLPGAVIPFGVMEESLKQNVETEREYGSLIGRLDRARRAQIDQILVRIKEIITDIALPHELSASIQKMFPPESRLMVRSSSNCEDLEGLSGAGLYESEANVTPECVKDAVRTVWASLWTRRAVISRAQAGIPHRDARMAVLIQEMIVPDYSFIIHTVNPVAGKKNEVYLELAAGLGETLASGRVPGTPYRMVCDKHSGSSRMLSFASFSRAFLPGSPGELVTEVVDYSKKALSTDDKFRETLDRRLMNIAVFVEKNMDRPQDIEGLVRGEDIYLVQSRPQQGVN